MILTHKTINELSSFSKNMSDLGFRDSKIGFGLSVMYPEALTILNEIEFQKDYNPVDFIKIRHKDNTNIIQNTINKTGIINSFLIGTQDNTTRRM